MLKHSQCDQIGHVLKILCVKFSFEIRGSITVRLISYFSGFDSTKQLNHKSFQFNKSDAESKLVKQEVSCTVILPIMK